jgi:hypothetical protein
MSRLATFWREQIRSVRRLEYVAAAGAGPEDVQQLPITGADSGADRVSKPNAVGFARMVEVPAIRITGVLREESAVEHDVDLPAESRILPTRSP